MLKITKRNATLVDFIKMKKIEPFQSWRYVAKLCNFGLMFGAKAATFAHILQTAQPPFTTEQCDEYIALTHSEDLYNEFVMKSKSGKYRSYEMRPEVECKYLTVATVMREAFLNGYEGLRDRITREHKFAIKYWYTRNWYGSVRHYPELAYMNIDPITHQVKGVDKKYFSYIFSHLMNNAANGPVQSGETVFIYNGWIHADKKMKEWALKSKICNTIHDSLDVYLWKPEKELMKSLINSSVHDKIRYPFEGVHHRMEPEVSDIRDYKHVTGYEEGEFTGNEPIKGHFYKHGEEEPVDPIEKAIEDYNNMWGTKLEWSVPEI